MKNKKLPDPLTATSEWYQEVIVRAELAEHSPVKGCMVIRPYGFAIWELIRDELDLRIKAHGALNAYFPLFIPQSFLAREEEHIKGFSSECAMVTHAGGEKLEEPLIIRPTSETIINDSMARWISSYRDLPLRINQWVNVIRWEKRPRLFLRNTEFLWQEGHTAHATETEARVEVSEIADLYHDFCEEILAIPTVRGQKSEQEKFAGAVESFSIEGLMLDGKGLQMGTIHYLGQNFSRMANVRFLGADGRHTFVEMTSWGMSTRLIGALIMTHGDDKGLVLPPAVAPIHIAIVPIGADKNDAVRDEASRVCETLKSLKLRAIVDDREGMSPGAKFYHWEVRGVPLRIEIGPRDVDAGKITLVWRTGTDGKKSMDATKLGDIPVELNHFQEKLCARTATSIQNRTISVGDRDEFIRCLIAQDGFIRAGWCGSTDCENGVKAKACATIRNLPSGENHGSENCIWCGSKGLFIGYFAKAY